MYVFNTIRNSVFLWEKHHVFDCSISLVILILTNIHIQYIWSQCQAFISKQCHFRTSAFLKCTSYHFWREMEKSCPLDKSWYLEHTKQFSFSTASKICSSFKLLEEIKTKTKCKLTKLSCNYTEKHRFFLLTALLAPQYWQHFKCVFDS